MRIVSACLAIAAGMLLPTLALGAPKPDAPTEPVLTKIKKAHCLAMYDHVAKSLKGRGPETVSTATRNGLKDFFVTRPGRVDCTGQREIPWTDEKDRTFIAGAIKASKADMTALYAVGPAMLPTMKR